MVYDEDRHIAHEMYNLLNVNWKCIGSLSHDDLPEWLKKYIRVNCEIASSIRT